MKTPTRPTLRCLSEDLTVDWDRTADLRAVQAGGVATVRVHSLQHMLIQKAVDDWPLDANGTDKRRESISGLSDPVFWKVKIDRWRGAVFVDADGQSWLVAAGRRYGGEAKDFYKQFMQDAANEASAFLPTEEDQALLLAERNETRVVHREGDIHASALDTAKRAASSPDGTATLFLESPITGADAIAEVTVFAHRAGSPDDLAGLLIEVEVRDWSYAALIEWDEQVFLAAICAQEDRWGVTISKTRMYSIELGSDEALDSLVQGHYGASQPGCMEAGTYAHTVHRRRLTESTVAGDPVRAVCGRWFVPRQDHQNLPMCPSCEALGKAFDLGPV